MFSCTRDNLEKFVVELYELISFLIYAHFSKYFLMSFQIMTV